MKQGLQSTDVISLLRRSVLFVPGNSQKMMEKAAKLNSDVVILDCEDSVAFGDKKKARDMASQALGSLSWSGKEVGVRTNGFETELWEDDLRSAVRANAQFVMIPKVESVEEVQLVDKIIRETSQSGSRFPKMFVTIENSKGLIKAEQILSSSELIAVVEFGAEDYALDLGILSSARSDVSTLYGRSYIVAVARSLGIDAIDQTFIGLNDPEGLRSSAREGKSLGFSGKNVIHPNQIDIVNECFGPSATDLKWALEVLEAWKIAEKEGRGAFRLNDTMVDIVHVKMAQRVLANARQLGIDVGRPSEVASQ
jgi:citrate lyase subunit beta / citryl-CoA lyase